MEDLKIERINFLARESKIRKLTEQEKAEQKKLRDEYRANIRSQLKSQLDNTYVVDKNGNKRKLM